MKQLRVTVAILTVAFLLVCAQVVSSTNAASSITVQGKTPARGPNKPGKTPTTARTKTPAPTNTMTSAPTRTNTPLPTRTNTSAPTNTNSPAPTSTDAPAPTFTPAPTDTSVPTSTDMPAPTNTLAPTFTDTPAPTDTPTPAIPTDTATQIVLVPTGTLIPTLSATITPSDTPLLLVTDTPTITLAPTDTSTPAPTDPPTPTDTITPAPTNTPVPTNTTMPSPTVTVTSSNGATAYWGTALDGVPQTGMTALATFENNAQKQVSIVNWGGPWKAYDGNLLPFDANLFERVRQHGSINMFSWHSHQSGGGVNQPDFQNQDIYNGMYDAYIRQWATDAKNWGYPFFLRFNHEMQGWWYAWGEGKDANGVIVNGNNPGDFVKAWKHVHDIFTQVGATNVTWVWCISALGAGNTRYPTLASIYPGDAYVDWTCIDAYNKNAEWLMLRQVMTGYNTSSYQNTYQQLLNLAPSKPMMIGESGSLEAGDGGTKKGDWFKSAFLTELPTYLPRVKAYVYFNSNDGDPTKTYPIESSSLSIQGFQTGIASSYYATNTFGNLAPGVIQPLR